MTIRSSMLTFREAFTLLPLRWTFPPLTALAAIDRVLKNRAAQSHLSMRTGCSALLSTAYSFCHWMHFKMGNRNNTPKSQETLGKSCKAWSTGKRELSKKAKKSKNEAAGNCPAFLCLFEGRILQQRYAHSLRMIECIYKQSV